MSHLSKYNTALVTGGAGFIGSWIARTAWKDDLHVIALDSLAAGDLKNLENCYRHDKFTLIKADITDFDALDALFEFYPDIDIIFHNAASKKIVSESDPHRDLAVNADGTLNLLELALKNDVKRFIHASTGSVYGEPFIFPTSEEHPLNPCSFYGISKMAGEKYVQLYHHEYGLDTTILRYHHVYGPCQPIAGATGVVPLFIAALLQHKQPIIYGTGKQVRSFTYVQDIVKANVLAAGSNNSVGAIYNVASGTKTSIQSLLKRIQTLTDTPDIKPVFRPRTPGDIDNFDVDVDKIREELHFKCDFSLDEGLTKTIEWVHNQLAQNGPKENIK